MKNLRFLIAILLLSTAACQTTIVTEEAVPTLMKWPTDSPESIVSDTPTLTFTPSVTITNTPIQSQTLPATITPLPTLIPSATPTYTPMPQPTIVPTLLPESFIFGQSTQGRDLVAYRLGTGSKFIFIIGGIHAGFESITIELVEELTTHFRNTPNDILPGITLIIIPVLNPDGYARGQVTEGRFNGNMVDLNRNWGCDWSPEAEWSFGAVDPGESVFSELETQALGSLAERIQPSAVLIFHAAANGVFAGDCDADGASFAMSQVYGEASLYPYGEEFNEYDLTGTAPNWFSSVGIPAADVELSTTKSTEFNRNLNGILAVQAWVLSRN